MTTFNTSLTQQTQTATFKLKRLAGAMLLAFSGLVQAATINIDAEPLDKALNTLAKQTGAQILFASELTANKKSMPLNGDLTVNEALTKLLAGTDLMVQSQGNNTFTIVRKPPIEAKAEELPTVNVSANSDKENAWSPVVGYLAKRSATGTKTDTSILETPASVQVIPRDVIDDQVAINLKDVYENISSVQQAGNTLNAQTEVLPIIRGFESPALLRNGLRATQAGAVDLVNVERVEVLKGPASILYGALEPGGIINYVTKRPQAETSYKVEQQLASFDFRRTSSDFTGALNEDETLLYRLNAAHTASNSFRDSMELERFAIAPSLLWKPSDVTELLIDLSYLKERQPYDTGIPLFSNGRPRVSDETSFIDPNLDGRSNQDFYAGYQFSHVFNSTWSIRNQLQYHKANNKNEALRPRGIQGNSLRLRYQNEDRVDDEVQFVLDATAKFKTGSIDHTLLIGTDYINQESDFQRFRVNIPNVLISNNPFVSFVPPINQNPSTDTEKTEWKSFYIQDQMSMLDDGRLKLLIGGRFDDVRTIYGGFRTNDVKDRAFTARLGLLYKLADNHSTYISTSESFRPQFAFAVDVAGRPLDPETGKQYEVGLKSTFYNEKLLTTFALYDIEKKNVAVFDNALFNATGQEAYFPGVRQRSRGFEFDASGNLTDQIKVIANYAYTDTEVLENKGDPTQVGDPLGGVAQNSSRIWLTYDFNNSELLSGLGMGIGARYVGDSTAQFDTNLNLDSYTVADLSLWYNWKNIRANLNAKNLFNKEYIVRSSDASIAHPGIPRSIFATVSILF